MKNTMIKLNSIVKDTATDLKGMVDVLHIEMDGSETYSFQPALLDPDTGEPVGNVWAVEARLVGGEMVDRPALPLAVLDTEVEDIATGFRGVAVSLALYATGCVHFNVQPRGLTKKGLPAAMKNFSILRLKGKALEALAKSAAHRERAAKPSPMQHSLPPKLA